MQNKPGQHGSQSATQTGTSVLTAKDWNSIAEAFTTNPTNIDNQVKSLKSTIKYLNESGKLNDFREQLMRMQSIVEEYSHSSG